MATDIQFVMPEIPVAEHTKACTIKCFCEQEHAQAVVIAWKEAVANADKSLIELRNSGVEEDVIATAVQNRQIAQEGLDTAYQNLIAVCSKMPEKIKDVDDDEAEESDDDHEGPDDSDDDEDELTDVSTRKMTETPPEEEEEDDEDGEYVPPARAH